MFPVSSKYNKLLGPTQLILVIACLASVNLQTVSNSILLGFLFTRIIDIVF